MLGSRWERERPLLEDRPGAAPQVLLPNLVCACLSYALVATAGRLMPA